MKDTWIKYFQEEITDSEKLELFSRLEKEPDSRNEFSELHHAWAISQLLTQKEDMQTACEGEKRLRNRINRKNTHRNLYRVLSYASVVCLAFIVSWYLVKNYFSDNEIVYTEIHVPSGQQLHITLADGSSVWLSPQSRLRLPNEFKRHNRILELDGEGFFSVVKDEKRPFIVKSKGYHVEVLGTKFNLFSYAKNPRYEVHLVKGKVQVCNDADKNDQVLLFPDEMAALVDGRLVKSTSRYNNEEFLKTGIYNFQATPFIDILEYLALWYDVQFDIKGSVRLTTKVNAKFRLNDDIESILTALRNAFEFNFKQIDDHKIEIYK